MNPRPCGLLQLEDGTVVPIKRASVNQNAGTGDGTVVAAVTNKRLRVIALAMVAGGTATDITFQSGDDTAISPLFANAANGGAVLPLNEHGWFETVRGGALKATTGAGSATGILVSYVEAP